METDQRSESVALSFFPALENAADIELECDAENITLSVEHATECGARISLRRQGMFPAESYTIDWYAVASEETEVKNKSLP